MRHTAVYDDDNDDDKDGPTKGGYGPRGAGRENKKQKNEVARCGQLLARRFFRVSVALALSHDAPFDRSASGTLLAESSRGVAVVGVLFWAKRGCPWP